MHSKLLDLLKPSVEALGYKLWGIEFLGSLSGNTLLRIYIDQEQGIKLNDCERVSQQLSRILDVEDFIKCRYILEVSSPGLNRSLFYPHQYHDYCGAMLSVKTKFPLNGQVNFKGILSQVFDTSIILIQGEKEFTIDFNDVKKAQLIVNLKTARS